MPVTTHRWADQLGVPVNDLHCLNLVSTGLAVTPTQLAERMGMTTGAVSKMLDRMEAQRLVRREHDPHDRRRITVHARPDRTDELAALYQPMAAYLTERIAGFTDDQLSLLTTSPAPAAKWRNARPPGSARAAGHTPRGNAGRRVV